MNAASVNSIAIAVLLGVACPVLAQTTTRPAEIQRAPGALPQRAIPTTPRVAPGMQGSLNAPCSDVSLARFDAVADTNYPNNRVSMMTFDAQITKISGGYQARLPDASQLWSLVQFTFRSSGQANLLPYDPVLPQLTAAQAGSLGYALQPNGKATCFIRAWTTNPWTKRPTSVGASTVGVSMFPQLALTFVDRGEIDVSGSGTQYYALAMVGFGANYSKGYEIEVWYFNGTGTLIKQAAFQIIMVNCGAAAPKHPSGSYLPRC
jgi:hypothetical protein